MYCANFVLQTLKGLYKWLYHTLHLLLLTKLQWNVYFLWFYIIRTSRKYKQYTPLYAQLETCQYSDNNNSLYERLRWCVQRIYIYWCTEKYIEIQRVNIKGTVCTLNLCLIIQRFCLLHYLYVDDIQLCITIEIFWLVAQRLRLAQG